MLKKIVISIFIVYCIMIESTIKMNFLSLGKITKDVFTSIRKIDNIQTIKSEETHVMYGPQTTQSTKYTDFNLDKEINKEVTENLQIKDNQEEIINNDIVLEETKVENEIKENISENRSKKNKETKKINENIEKEKIEENKEIVESIETKEKVENNQETINNKVESQNEEVYPENCLVIGNKVIKITITSASQKNINTYDVVQDNKDISTYDNIVIFGHNYNSFRILKNINVGETIKLNNYGKIEEYIVFRSEKGKDNSDRTDIISLTDGKALIYNYHGYDETLKLVTCNEGQRWVISAYKNI